MELNKERLAKLKAIVDGLSLDDAVSLYNAVCYECNYPDNRIYILPELEEELDNDNTDNWNFVQSRTCDLLPELQ